MTRSSANALDLPKRRASTRIGGIAFGAALAIGVIYVGTQLIGDLVQVRDARILPYLLWGSPCLLRLDLSS